MNGVKLKIEVAERKTVDFPATATIVDYKVIGLLNVEDNKETALEEEEIIEEIEDNGERTEQTVVSEVRMRHFSKEL